MIVTDTFPPDINGVARTLQTLTKGLAKRGHSVDVITTTDGAAEENAKAGVNVQTVAAFPMPGYKGIRVGLTSRRRMKALIRSQKPDALYVAVESLMGVNAIRAARECEVGVVSGFHTNFHSYTRDYSVPILMNLMAMYLRYVHNSTARTLTPSESTAEHLRSLGVNNVGVMGRGVDTDLFQPARRDEGLRREWNVADGAPVAMFVGRIAAEKNLPLAVRAFQQLMADNPGARCVFVGDGPRAQWLQESHPEFIHAGARTGEDLARHYASADVFVFPSLTETFGNVLLEAMASRLATVSFDYAAAQQFVRHGENGFKAAPGDDAAFLQAFKDAVARWSDDKLRDAAHDTAQTLSWDAIISQFEHELIAASKPANSPATQQQP
jgi:glycosyltransferase involved in cell wall biosynthesis